MEALFHQILLCAVLEMSLNAWRFLRLYKAAQYTRSFIAKTLVVVQGKVVEGHLRVRSWLALHAGAHRCARCGGSGASDLMYIVRSYLHSMPVI